MQNTTSKTTQSSRSGRIFLNILKKVKKKKVKKVALGEMAGPFWAFCKGYIVWQNGQKLPILGLKLHVPKRQENHAGS